MFRFAIGSAMNQDAAGSGTCMWAVTQCSFDEPTNCFERGNIPCGRNDRRSHRPVSSGNSCGSRPRRLRVSSEPRSSGTTGGLGRMPGNYWRLFAPGLPCSASGRPGRRAAGPPKQNCRGHDRHDQGQHGQTGISAECIWEVSCFCWRCGQSPASQQGRI